MTTGTLLGYVPVDPGGVERRRDVRLTDDDRTVNEKSSRRDPRTGEGRGGVSTTPTTLRKTEQLSPFYVGGYRLRLV